tara:strand:- start:171 stop:1229 length:1059 start_codon:yes stop_codon:yes gene_type:complete
MKVEKKIIGILGGGQLGKMLSTAANKLGFDCHIFDPDINSPAKAISKYQTTSEYTDKKKIKTFAKKCHLITYEFENIPTKTIKYIEKYCSVFPKANALSISQDREKEKEFFQNLSLDVVPYNLIKNKSERNFKSINVKFPAILKTCRNGYDGKGQKTVNNKKELAEAFKELSYVDCILEEKINFNKEISIIISRDVEGNVVCYEPGENKHSSGILKKTTVPAKITSDLKHKAILIAGKLVNSLNYIGVMGIEFFVENEHLFLNEIAPRVHNTGHWTQDGCLIDQFEQHIRCISNLPIGDGKRYADVEMVNLLGSEVESISKFKNNSVYIYGKSEIKQGRKMGHVNIIKKGVI